MNIATPAYTGIEHFTQNRLGTYAQDQIKIGGLTILVGDARIGSNQPTTTRSPTSIRYRTPSRSRGEPVRFTNSVTASRLTSVTKPHFSPMNSDLYGIVSGARPTGQQYEGGIILQPPGSKSFFTAAVFNLTEQNVATTDPDHPMYSISTGAIRSRGLELEAHTNVNENINVIGSYTYLDSLVTESNTTNLDKVTPGIPRYMASLWGTYRFNSGALTGLQLGAGVRYVGESWGDTTNTYQVPGYALVDMSVQYDLGNLSPDLTNYRASINGETCSINITFPPARA